LVVVEFALCDVLLSLSHSMYVCSPACSGWLRLSRFADRRTSLRPLELNVDYRRAFVFRRFFIHKELRRYSTASGSKF
jgi:hypothetical protein